MAEKIVKDSQGLAKDLVNDCISRKAAICIERNATVDTNPSHFEAHQKFMKFMEDGNGRTVLTQPLRRLE